MGIYLPTSLFIKFGLEHISAKILEVGSAPQRKKSANGQICNILVGGLPTNCKHLAQYQNRKYDARGRGCREGQGHNQMEMGVREKRFSERIGRVGKERT